MLILFNKIKLISANVNNILFQEDIQLMCRNAMVYNRPETVYYKAAKKLLHASLKITNADKLRSSHLMLPFLSELSVEQLGFELDSSAEQSEEDDVIKSNVKCEESAKEHIIKSEQNNDNECQADISVKPNQSQFQ